MRLAHRRLFTTQELASPAPSGEVHCLPRPQMVQETEELPRIVRGSGAQFGGEQEEKIQVITLSPENGASDSLADITIMFYVHIYPYDTIHMFHDGPVAIQ